MNSKVSLCPYLSSRYLTLDDFPQILHRSHDNVIDISERIAGKQDGPSLIVQGPPRVPRIAKNANVLTVWPIYEKLVVIFVLVIHMSAL